MLQYFSMSGQLGLLLIQPLSKLALGICHAYFESNLVTSCVSHALTLARPPPRGAFLLPLWGGLALMSSKASSSLSLFNVMRYAKWIDRT